MRKRLYVTSLPGAMAAPTPFDPGADAPRSGPDASSGSSDSSGSSRQEVPSAPDVTVIAPAHNEEEYLLGSLAGILSGLRSRGASFEIIVSENGSTDATLEVAREIERRQPEVRVLTLPTADYGRALRSGFLAAQGRIIVNFDVDFVDLAFFDEAVALAEGPDRADVVIGSKRITGADDTRPLSRRAGTWGFSTLLRLGFGLRASDTHGIKLLRRSALAPLVRASRSGADIFDTELILRAERTNLRVRELPVRVSETRPPRTAFASRIPRTLRGLGLLRVRLWRDPTFRPRLARRRWSVSLGARRAPDEGD